MDQRDLEVIVGRLYLALMDRERQIEELTALVPKAPVPPTIFSIAQPREGMDPT